MTLIPYSKVATERLILPTSEIHESDGDVISSSNSAVGINMTQSFNGFKQPGYRERIRMKQNATTIASGTKTTIVAPYITGHVMYSDLPDHSTYRASFTGVPYAQYLGTASYDTSLDSEISNDALVGFLKKCRGTQRQLMTGVFIGELRQTLELIKKPALAFRKLLTSYVSSVRNGAHRYGRRDRAKLAANQWLEYSFGIRPLVSDIQGGARALAKITNRQPTMGVLYKSERELPRASPTVTKTSFCSTWIPVYLIDRKIQKGMRVIRGEVLLKTLGDKGSILESFGFEPADFIPTVYNLIPYSFLVDYFTNIGDVLESYSFCRSDLVWFCDTWRRSVTQTLVVQPAPLPNPKGADSLLSSHFDPCISTYDVTSFSRSNLPLGNPSVTMRLPGFGSKALNIAALASLRVL